MWPTYIINLADNTARLASCRRELDTAGIPFERLEAVNGWTLEDAEVARAYDRAANARRAKHPLVRPEIGCYLSHVRAWERIGSGDAPGGVVLEDDFRVTGPLRDTLEALAHDDGAWDIVKLYAMRPPGRLRGVRRIAPGIALGTPYRVPSTTTGYVIRKDSAARLARTALPFFRPIDEDHKFFWEAGLDIRITDPLPLSLGPQETATGTIGDTRKRAARADPRSAVARALAILRYQLGYNLALHLHRLTGRPA